MCKYFASKYRKISERHARSLLQIKDNLKQREALKKIIDEQLVDYIAMDIKDSKRDIRKNIDLIMNSGIDYEFRSTIVPVLHSEEEIIKMANLIKGAKRYYLQNFRPGKTLDPEYEKIVPYSFDKLGEIKDKVKHLFDVCEVR